MTDEQITATNPAERLRVMIDLLGDGGHGCFKKTSLCAILAHIDAQAAEIARLREALTYAWGLVEDATYNDSVMMIRQSRFLSTYYDENGIRAALAQETQP
jgi:hypothetical protein